MQRKDIFVSPIWTIDNLPIDNTKLETHAYSLQEKIPQARNPEGYSPNSTFRLKWKSHDMTSVDWKPVPELQKLITIINENVEKCFSELNPRPGVKIFLSGCWYSIYPPGVGLEIHPHPGHVLSGTYYIKTAPDCGDLVFLTPDQTTYYNYSAKSFYNRNEITSVKHFIEPKVGSFVCAPSNLMHAVGYNHSDSDRIALSFNYAIVDPHPYNPNQKFFKT